MRTLDAAIVATLGSFGLEYRLQVPTRMNLRFAGSAPAEHSCVDFVIGDSRPPSRTSFNLVIDVLDAGALPVVQRMAILLSEDGDGMWLCAARSLDVRAVAAAAKEVSSRLQSSPLGLTGQTRSLCLAFVSLEPRKAWLGELSLGRSRSGTQAKNLLERGIGWATIGEDPDELSSRTEIFAPNEVGAWYDSERRVLVFSDELLAQCPKFKRRTFLIADRNGAGFRLRDYHQGKSTVVSSVGEIVGWRELWMRYPVHVEHPRSTDLRVPLANTHHWESLIETANHRIDSLE